MKTARLFCLISLLGLCALLVTGATITTGPISSQQQVDSVSAADDLILNIWTGNTNAPYATRRIAFSNLVHGVFTNGFSQFIENSGWDGLPGFYAIDGTFDSNLVSRSYRLYNPADKGSSAVKFEVDSASRFSNSVSVINGQLTLGNPDLSGWSRLYLTNQNGRGSLSHYHGQVYLSGTESLTLGSAISNKSYIHISDNEPIYLRGLTRFRPNTSLDTNFVSLWQNLAGTNVASLDTNGLLTAAALAATNLTLLSVPTETNHAATVRYVTEAIAAIPQPSITNTITSLTNTAPDTIQLQDTHSVQLLYHDDAGMIYILPTNAPTGRTFWAANRHANCILTNSLGNILSSAGDELSFIELASVNSAMLLKLDGTNWLALIE